MFAVEIEGRAFGLKPMNCPGHCLLYSLGAAQLPRAARCGSPRPGNLHRNELSGVLHGLLRVRHFVQDDAHIYCTHRADPGRAPRLPRLRVLPLRPLRARHARGALAPAGQQARHGRGVGLRRGGARARRSPRRGSSTSTSEGEGSFYGPKIDLHMSDSLGRSWQLGTVQLDLQMPKRFGLAYQGDDNAEHTPAMIHRALLGSLERFVGVYLEHTGGDLPLFLAPEQVRDPAGRDPHLGRRGVACRPAARRGVPRRRWTSARRRSAGGSATRSLRRCPTSSSGATASRSTPSRSGDGAVNSLQRARTRSCDELRSAASI